MKRTLLTILGLALVGSVITLNAQPCQGGGPNQNGPAAGCPGICPLLDSDGDGILSANEILNSAKAIAKLDKNNDGQVTKDEVCTGEQCKAAAGSAKACMVDGKARCGVGKAGFMARFDANADGVLSANEIANLPAVLAELDKNDDGQLTADEFCPRATQSDGPGCRKACARGCARADNIFSTFSWTVDGER